MITTVTAFDCAAAGTVTTRFLGPDTIELNIEERQLVLTRSVTASGAQYVAQDTRFWNKGESALLEIDGTSHQCTRR